MSSAISEQWQLVAAIETAWLAAALPRCQDHPPVESSEGNAAGSTVGPLRDKMHGVGLREPFSRTCPLPAVELDLALGHLSRSLSSAKSCFARLPPFLVRAAEAPGGLRC